MEEDSQRILLPCRNQVGRPSLRDQTKAVSHAAYVASVPWRHPSWTDRCERWHWATHVTGELGPGGHDNATDRVGAAERVRA